MKFLHPKTNWLFIKFIGQQLKKNDCLNRAGALAFATLLTLVPLLAVILVVLAKFPFINSVGNDIQTFIFTNFVPTSGETIYAYVKKFIEQASHLSLIGSISLVVTSILLLSNIEQTLNAIWQVTIRRNGLISLLLHWTILFLAPLLIALGFLISSYIFSLSFVMHATEWLHLKAYLLILTPFLLSAAAFSFLYIVMPNCKVKIHNAFIGGVVAAILFELAKQGFILYVRYFPSYELLYGALAAIPLFLIWIYISWLVVLFGAEVSYALGAFRKRPL